jgi:hypothetical protein
VIIVTGQATELLRAARDDETAFLSPARDAWYWAGRLNLPRPESGLPRFESLPTTPASSQTPSDAGPHDDAEPPSPVARHNPPSHSARVRVGEAANPGQPAGNRLSALDRPHDSVSLFTVSLLNAFAPHELREQQLGMAEHVAAPLSQGEQRRGESKPPSVDPHGSDDQQLGDDEPIDLRDDSGDQHPGGGEPADAASEGL